MQKNLCWAVDELVQSDIKNSATEYRSVVKEDILKMEMALRTEIKESKTDTIKWMVALFISFFVAIVGLVFTVVKLVRP